MIVIYEKHGEGTAVQDMYHNSSWNRNILVFIIDQNIIACLLTTSKSNDSISESDGTN